MDEVIPNKIIISLHHGKRKVKYMKNPNKYGTVTHLSGNRRRPWVAKEGISGRQKPIGYAATREEALILLANYNNNPWDLDADRVTFKELYDLWLERRAGKLGISNQRTLKSAYNHCRKLDNMKYRQIKSYQMQDCIDNCGLSPSMQAAIKSLFKHLDHFAMELDVVSKCYSDLLTSEPIPETSKTIFTDEEVNRLWEHQNMPWVDSVLILLYSGFRISELLNLRTDSVDLEAQTMCGGVKTAAGKNRIVPIHSKISTFVGQRLDNSTSGYLFELRGKKISESEYRLIWNDIMNEIGMHHTPHECRHTFRSRMDSAGANKVCIDLIMGHKSNDVGERIYTHKTIEELKSNIELITN